ncbi:MAG TPA: PepSY domain-containing protein [Chitinophaga sp.]|uniref:PepSY domain-containing protein n=1 Tax=Chitinophaga sp. TaxID=1869181 RepID=UPI002DBE25A8|nr:PepSY domain-containing protein [Chitinophaga sp.]HEU4554636.1 PepSY domain-containing protein [Chitinophaga sp.]
MKKNIYKLHRTLSLIIALPVLLWAISGFMHPLMTTIRPQVATQVLPARAIDTTHIKTPLSAALKKHHIDSVAGFRLVHIDTTWFYQVQVPGKQEPLYFSAINGKLLTAGNWLYAQYLARQFLEGADGSDSAAAPVAAASSPEAGALHDCCDAATSCVLNNEKGSKVRDASMLTAFNEEYKEINRLLPVYKVTFERADGIRIYVETTQDRFAFAMDNHRALFDCIFRNLHTWDWLNLLGRAKHFVLGCIALTALITSVLGLYIFFTTKSKKASGNGLVKARRYHRYTAVIASLFTLMWTFSGSYYAFSRLQPDTRYNYFVNDHFAASAADIPFGKLQQKVAAPITNVSMVRLPSGNYWQVYTKGKPVIQYVHTGTFALLPRGDAQYARHLAAQFSGNHAAAVTGTAYVTKFTDEYNFADKRLPVWKVAYNTRHHERYYVETASGRLSVRVNDLDMPQGYSFALFHKHHFMDWGGKTVRDISTMFWVLMQVVMVSVGLTLYVVWRRKTGKARRAPIHTAPLSGNSVAQ